MIVWEYLRDLNQTAVNIRSTVISLCMYVHADVDFFYLIRKTSPCNEHPFTSHFYIVKLGFTGVYIFFLFLLQNIDCGYSLEPPH